MTHKRCSVFALLAVLLSTAGGFSQQSREVTASPKPVTAPQQGGYYALVIGINGYGDFPTLKTPRNDAASVARVLKNHYRFVTNLLLDATRDQIIGALDEYISKLHEEDSLLIYFAGHGWRDKAAGDAYWIPVDGQRNTRSHWITAADITDEARAIPARHLLIISDSCFSGTLAERDIHPTVGIPSERTILLEKLRAGKSRHLMSSGGDEPVSDDAALGHDPNHSVFANALLNGLAQMQLDEFTGRELFDQYVFGPVGGQSRQVPEYNLIRDSGHNSGDFVFFRQLRLWLGHSSSNSLANLPLANATALPVISAAKLASSGFPGLLRMTIQGSGFTGVQQVKIDSKTIVFRIVSDTEMGANIGLPTSFVNGSDVEVCNSTGCNHHPLSWIETSAGTNNPPQPQPASNTISLSPVVKKIGLYYLTGTMHPGAIMAAGLPEIGQAADRTPVHAFLTFDLSQIPKGSHIAHAELKCKTNTLSRLVFDSKIFNTVLLEVLPPMQFVVLTGISFDSKATLLHTMPYNDLEKPQDVTDAVAAAYSSSLYLTFRLRFSVDRDHDSSNPNSLFFNTQSTTLQVTLK
jgi:hypothetical protein